MEGGDANAINLKRVACDNSFAQALINAGISQSEFAPAVKTRQAFSRKTIRGCKREMQPTVPDRLLDQRNQDDSGFDPERDL